MRAVEPPDTRFTQANERTFLAWNRTRTWRGRLSRDQRVSVSVVHSAVLTIRNFLDDITLWG